MRDGHGLQAMKDGAYPFEVGDGRWVTTAVEAGLAPTFMSEIEKVPWSSPLKIFFVSPKMFSMVHSAACKHVLVTTHTNHPKCSESISCEMQSKHHDATFAPRYIKASRCNLCTKMHQSITMQSLH
jgi:hypothetical protein